MFDKYGFINYLNIDPKDEYCLSNYDRIIVQIDSIGRVNYIDNLKPFDYLILDEFRSLLRYLSCDNLKKKEEKSFYLFEYYIQTSKRIIVLDADFTPDCSQYLVNL